MRCPHCMALIPARSLFCNLCGQSTLKLVEATKPDLPKSKLGYRHIFMSLFLLLVGFMALAGLIRQKAPTAQSSPTPPVLEKCGEYQMYEGWLMLPDSGGAIIEERQRFTLVARAQGFKVASDGKGNLIMERNSLGYVVTFNHIPLFGGLDVRGKIIDAQGRDVTCARSAALYTIGRTVSHEFSK